MTLFHCTGGGLPARILRVVLLLFALSPVAANAEWTGISLDFGDYDSDWKFDSDTRVAKITEISFSIEEKTRQELRVGATIGVEDFRVDSDIPGESRKYDGQYLEIFFRYPKPLSERLSLHGQFNFGFHTGSESGSGEDRGDYDWAQIEFQFGLGVTVGDLRIMPYVSYKDIDGDISTDAGTQVFEMDTPESGGVRFDLFTDDSAYIRIEVFDGADNGLFLSFARRY